MIVKLPFASDQVALDLRGMRVRPLTPNAPQRSRDVSALIEHALDTPLDGPRLADLAAAKSTATIIVPDATRKAWLNEVIPPIVQRLERAGIQGPALTILVANGTHPRVGPEMIAKRLGRLPAGVVVVEHDCRDPENLVSVGELRPGLDLRLNRCAVDCDLLMTVGTVRHHYFAGFGGGPKMVFPGVAGYEEIQANHGLVLDVSNGVAKRSPGCEPGVLSGNPVAEEIANATALRPPDFSIGLVEGAGDGPAWAGGGPWRAVFASAIEKLRSWYETEPAAPFDLVVAGGGGAPSDSTLIQAHKALDAACRFLAPEGEILFVAAIDRGLGSRDIEPFVADPRPERILDRLAGGWVQYGHTTLRLVEKTSRFRVSLLSQLDVDLAQNLGFKPVADPSQVIERWRSDHPRASVAVMAGSPVFPRA